MIVTGTVNTMINELATKRIWRQTKTTEKREMSRTEEGGFEGESGGEGTVALSGVGGLISRTSTGFGQGAGSKSDDQAREELKRWRARDGAGYSHLGQSHVNERAAKGDIKEL